MKQYQHPFRDYPALKVFLDQAGEHYAELGGTGILFHIYSEILDRVRLEKIVDMIRTQFPEAGIVGATTNGNIVNGCFSRYTVSLTCTIFESKNTRFLVRHLDLTDENMAETAQTVREIIAENEWISFAEILTTMRSLDIAAFCDQLKDVRGSVAIAGGGAFSDDINNNESLLIASDKGTQDSGIVFVFIGGSDFHAMTTHITGWKPLGRPIEVTESEGIRLVKLNGEPAYDIYNRYLNIKNDENFLRNTLEFPFMLEQNGIQLLRAPIYCLPDKSIVMTSGIPSGTKMRIAYGDPQVVLQEVQKRAQSVSMFKPEAILLFSCAARKYYWDGKYDSETGPFQRLAPTAGFYTSGELLRSSGCLNQHSVTLVIAALREGDGEEDEIKPFRMKQELPEGTVSLVNRLATFIDATTAELIDANRQLKIRAMMDGLTALLNRSEMQRRVDYACRHLAGHRDDGITMSCIMIDIDNFKHINDTYGHNEGDLVLIDLARILREITAAHSRRCTDADSILHDLKSIPENISDDSFVENTVCGCASVGRWGGEEFLILLPNENAAGAQALAEELRRTFSETEFEHSGRHTLSAGTAEYRPGEVRDAFIDRADKRLYLAKNSGKNRVVAAE